MKADEIERNSWRGGQRLRIRDLHDGQGIQSVEQSLDVIVFGDDYSVVQAEVGKLLIRLSFDPRRLGGEHVWGQTEQPLDPPLRKCGQDLLQT